MKHNYNQKCKEELHLLYFHDGKMETMAIDDEKIMAQVRRIFGVKEKPKRVWSPWKDYGNTVVGLTTSHQELLKRQMDYRECEVPSIRQIRLFCWSRSCGV